MKFQRSDRFVQKMSDHVALTSNYVIYNTMLQLKKGKLQLKFPRFSSCYNRLVIRILKYRTIDKSDILPDR